MAYLDQKTGRIELTSDDRDSLYHGETPDFIKNFWGWISRGKITPDDDVPKPTKVNILK